MASTHVTASMVRRVRRLLKRGFTCREVADQVGVSPVTVSKIGRGHRDHLLAGKRNRLAPEGYRYCEKCEGIQPTPCPRCEQAAQAADDAQRFEIRKWDNIEPVSPGCDELVDVIGMMIGCDPVREVSELDQRWTVTEGGAL